MKNKLAPNLLHSLDFFAGLFLINVWDKSKSFYTIKVGRGSFKNNFHSGSEVIFEKV